MQKLTEGLYLYHGSYCEVTTPDLHKCAKYKDFGQGFYLTTSKEQAQKFIGTSVKKAISSGEVMAEQNYGYVSVYCVQTTDDLKIKEYPTADVDWLHCVVAHRKRETFPAIVEKLQDYDVVSGKIANDNTNATIAAYMALAYGEIGSESADRMCISLLLPNRLQDQFCFRTTRALQCISFIGSERIWI